MADRRSVINNTNVAVFTPGMKKAIYRIMDKLNADECVVNVMTEKSAEVDLFYHGKLVDWGRTIFVKKEEE